MAVKPSDSKQNRPSALLQPRLRSSRSSGDLAMRSPASWTVYGLQSASFESFEGSLQNYHCKHSIGVSQPRLLPTLHACPMRLNGWLDVSTAKARESPLRPLGSARTRGLEHVHRWLALRCFVFLALAGVRSGWEWPDS